MRDNIVTRFIKPAGRKIGLDFVNWRCLRTSHATWLKMAGQMKGCPKPRFVTLARARPWLSTSSLSPSRSALPSTSWVHSQVLGDPTDRSDSRSNYVPIRRHVKPPPKIHVLSLLSTLYERMTPALKRPASAIRSRSGHHHFKNLGQFDARLTFRSWNGIELRCLTSIQVRGSSRKESGV